MTTTKEAIAALLPDNTTQLITPAKVRSAFNSALDEGNRLFERGWNRNDPDHMGDITKDETANTWTITPKTGMDYFEFWVKGVQYQKTAAMTISLDVSASGTYYIVFDDTGALAIVDYSTVNQDSFMNAITDLYYYNKNEDEFQWAIDEQHGIDYGYTKHFKDHFCEGFCWPGSGSEAEGFADSSDVYTKITSGALIDEDIIISHADIADMKFGYKEGADGAWKFTAADLKVGYIESGDTYVSVNEEVTGVWQLTESGSTTDYIIYLIMGSNFEGLEMFKVIGQQFYGSRSTAREALDGHIHQINLSGVPGAEARPLYAYICKRNGDIEDSGSPLYEAIVDLRAKRLS